MSADNWTYCPKCSDMRDQAMTKARAALEQQYGTIPAAEYVAAMRKLDNTPAAKASLREDYEIGMVEGSLVIDYRAHCDNCKFTHTLKSDVRVYPPPAK